MLKMMEKPIQPVRQAMHSMKKECTKVAALTGMGSSIPATFQAAPVPSAMAIAIRITCTTLFVPELVSPKIMSRMALVKSSPGTSSIKAPMTTESGRDVTPAAPRP